ncbi:MAG: hypothetical protein M3Z64_03865 [Verrucomicrobiota bacterium]|nr:hypothetical protein [Verrucomicrobiota bacterium]
MDPITTRRRVRIFCSLVALLVLVPQGAADAIILFRTGDPTANATAPTGSLANSGWQFQGTFGDYLGTPVAPHFFITAQHIGSAPTFVFRGVNYTPVRSFDDPASDLRLWEVSETFPAYAPLYTGSAEVGGHIVVFGRGTQRGAERIVNGQLVGWTFGPSDSVQRWGENQVARIVQHDGKETLYALFDQAGLPNECHLSGGDSAGGVFLDDGGVWKLAGLNYDIDSFASGPDAGGPFNAAMFDERGSYTAAGMLVTGDAPVPSGFYASRISTRVAWITSIISPRLANISARTSVRNGDAVSIGGFIIRSGAGMTKRVLLRALGPSLQANGAPLSGRLENPLLELHAADGGLIAANDDWRSDPSAAALQSTGLAPTADTEAALVVTLSAGSYTAVMRGVNGSNGIGLLEVYDIDEGTNDARLVNLSARAFVSGGDDLLIGGVIAHTGAQRLLLRALGPELAGLGVADALGDPALELHDANGALLVSNDSWRDAANSADIAATGIAPADAREAAVLFTPNIGAYTAIVRGSGNTTGVALLEAYLLL